MKLWTQQLQEKIQRKALSSPATQINKAIANIQIEFVKQRNQIQNPKRRRERKKKDEPETCLGASNGEYRVSGVLVSREIGNSTVVNCPTELKSIQNQLNNTPKKKKKIEFLKFIP